MPVTIPKLTRNPASRVHNVPLAWRILLSASALLALLIIAMLTFVSIQAQRFVSDRIIADLLQSRKRIEDTIQDQFTQLSLTARLVASFPALKAIMAETDLPTMRDFLLSYQQQNHAPDLLVVVDLSGRVLARTDSTSADTIPNFQSGWMQPVMNGQTAFGTLRGKEGVYNAAMVSADAGGVVFGFVIAGTRIDAAFARRLAVDSHTEIVILGDSLIASTLATPELPWRSASEWQATGRLGTQPQFVHISGEAYSALPTQLRFPGAPIIIGLLSNDKAIAPYRYIQTGLLILGLIAAGAGIAASAIFARTITKPIAELVSGTREVAAGNFDFRLNVQRGDEIGYLADSFNTMIRGLREREDMQKFVSQSTLDMIRSSQLCKAAGERKLITIFFSDIRGFTSLSEHLDPEEVVRVLNQVFTVQAEKVKKFSGDIDKYIGDAVMALFQDDSAAINAIRCGTEINEALHEFNRAQGPGAVRVELGIGIATGEVVLGSIGSQDRRDFTAIGSHVNLASRLCALARPGEILLADSTYRQVQSSLNAEALVPQHVKGFSRPVAVYRVL